MVDSAYPTTYLHAYLAHQSGIPTHLRTNIYTNTSLHARTPACMHAYLPTCTHAPSAPTHESIVYVRACACACERTYIRLYLPTSLQRTYVRTYVRIYLPPSLPKPTHQPSRPLYSRLLLHAMHARIQMVGEHGACHP